VEVSPPRGVRLSCHLPLAGPTVEGVDALDEDDILRRAGVDALQPLEGGVSSLTFASHLAAPREARPVVVKVAPPGLAPVRNRDVLRQARLIRRLADLEGFPVPEILREDGGAPPLFVMELCPGESYEPRLDTSVAPPAPEVAARRMRTAARALARLHRDDPAALGLDDETPVAVADELRRWELLVATVDGDLAPGHQALHARLAGRVPSEITPTLLHGDYRLANMLFVGETLCAVIDWEIWSVGDPRSDLAWLLMHADPAHVFHEDRSARDEAAGSALPTPAELTAEYVAGRRADGADDAVLHDVTIDLEWFVALSCYKVASTTAAIVKRDRRRPTRDPKLVVAERHLPAVIAAGHAALDQLNRA
jgi:aminoglycoside phosphotransferase (APT) family kinase protein